MATKQDQSYIDDTTYTDVGLRDEGQGFNWWLLLLIPLFFALGWWAKPNQYTDGSQYGVGGAPYNVMSPCPSPMNR